MTVPSPAKKINDPKSLNWEIIREKSAGARPENSVSHFYLSNEPYAAGLHEMRLGIWVLRVPLSQWQHQQSPKSVKMVFFFHWLLI
jgi:hypothetical protein